MPDGTDIRKPPGLRAAQRDALAGPRDLLVIGGGATGFACALDALSRGYSVALVERDDFGEGTSSRSTKLIHGGVRYLRQGHLPLVRESLRERSWFLRAAPHLVQPLEFVIPCVSKAWKTYYRAGMALYDALAGGHRAARSGSLTAEQVLSRVPGCRREGMRGGVHYTDGQFDDARMIMCFLRAMLRQGGVALNHAPAVELVKEAGRIRGAVVEDHSTGRAVTVLAKAVINATGVFGDSVRRLDDPAAAPRIMASQGIHFVLDAAYLGGASALMIPKTADGRVLFAIPWHGRVLYGTTDTRVPEPSADPRPLEEEVDYLIAHAPHVFDRPVGRDDIIALFAGLRPLPRPDRQTATAAVSRDFKLEVSPAGLLSVYGGKWTTCRAMGEAAVERIINLAGLPYRPSRTRDLVFEPGREPSSHTEVPDEEWIRYAIEEEMACTVEDVLLRRTRLGLLDPAAARDAGPVVEGILGGLKGLA